MALTAKRTAPPYIDPQTALVNGSSPKIDRLLEPLVQMSGAEEIDVYLSQLIAVHAEPVINRIIRYKLRHNLNRSGAEAEAEDLRQEAIAQLLVELQKLRSDITTLFRSETCEGLRPQLPTASAPDGCAVNF